MENDQDLKDEKYNLSFFKKIWYSICKFEKYPEMAALGAKKALIYLTEIIIIFSIIYTVIFIKHIKIKYNFTQSDITLSEQLVLMIENENNLDEQEKDALNYFISEDGFSDFIVIGMIFFVVVISFYMATLLDVIMISGFGLITCFIIRIKINYKALFNMSIYSLTLPIFLRIIYYFITMLTNFTIKYFSTMYIAISYISLAAAIFLIKSNIMKQHLELIKIIEEGKDKIEETMMNLKKPKVEDQKEEKNNDKDTDNKNQKDANNTGSEEQESKA